MPDVHVDTVVIELTHVMEMDFMVNLDVALQII